MGAGKQQTGHLTYRQSTEVASSLTEPDGHIDKNETSPDSHSSALRGLLALSGSSETNTAASNQRDPTTREEHTISTFDPASSHYDVRDSAESGIYQRPNVHRTDTRHHSMLSSRSMGQNEPGPSQQSYLSGHDQTGDLGRQEPSASVSAGSTSGPVALAGSSVELLKVYRYNIAPWLDICDSSQPFGVALLTKLHTTIGLRSSVLRLAAIYSNMVWSIESIDAVATTPATVTNESDAWTTTGEAMVDVLNILSEVLPDLATFWSSENSARNRECLLERLQNLKSSHLTRCACWLLIRLGKRHFLGNTCHSSAYVSAELSRALIMGIDHITLPFSTTYPQQAESVSSAAQYTYDMIALCVEAVMFVQGDGDRTLQHRYGLSRVEVWTTLIQRLAHWYKHRSQAFQPIIELYRMDGLGTENDYPTIVFTSGAALLANQLYHTGMLLLLQNRPRFGHSSSQNSPSMSTLWHAHRICGIAIQNDRPGWWDPCLVASLIIAGRTATHPSQHNAILQTLESVQLLTGWAISPYLEQMKIEWHLADGW